MSTSGMHSGLFTLHFVPIRTTEDERAAGSGGKLSLTGTSTEFGDWHVLLRFVIENEVLSVRQEAKIFVMTDEFATGSSSDDQFTIPRLGRVLRPVKDRTATVSMRCHCHWQYTDAFRFDLGFTQLEGAVIGADEVVLNDVTVSCEGSQAYGWYIGEATVKVGGKPFSLPHRLRFVLNPYVGAQCTMCLDPVYAQGFTCTECGVVEYCSQECQSAHMTGGHGLLCPILHRTYTQRSGKVLTETESRVGLVAWWHSSENASYSILVDYRNSLGQPIEFFLNTLRPAQEVGLRFRRITEAGTTPKEVGEEELVDFACTVFRAVSENAISEGCASLASACLNNIFVFSRHIETIVESHVFYYYSYLCEDFEGTICSVEEYVAFARPMHELGVAVVEYALKSPTALIFWQRAKLAKNVLTNLYNVNSSCQCSGIHELVKVMPAQQRETLYLLSKLSLIMASRAPRKEGQRLLEQAEKCLRECLPKEHEVGYDAAAHPRSVSNNNSNKNNSNGDNTNNNAVATTNSISNNESESLRVHNEGLEEMEPSYLSTLYYRLSALLLLYGDKEKAREAAVLKVQGDALLAKANVKLGNNPVATSPCNDGKGKVVV